MKMNRSRSMPRRTVSDLRPLSKSARRRREAMNNDNDGESFDIFSTKYSRKNSIGRSSSYSKRLESGNGSSEPLVRRALKKPPADRSLQQQNGTGIYGRTFSEFQKTGRRLPSTMDDEDFSGYHSDSGRPRRTRRRQSMYMVRSNDRAIDPPNTKIRNNSASSHSTLSRDPAMGSFSRNDESSSRFQLPETPNRGHFESSGSLPTPGSEDIVVDRRFRSGTSMDCLPSAPSRDGCGARGDLIRNEAFDSEITSPSGRSSEMKVNSKFAKKMKKRSIVQRAASAPLKPVRRNTNPSQLPISKMILEKKRQIGASKSMAAVPKRKSGTKKSDIVKHQPGDQAKPAKKRISATKSKSSKKERTAMKTMSPKKQSGSPSSKPKKHAPLGKKEPATPKKHQPRNNKPQKHLPGEGPNRIKKQSPKIKGDSSPKQGSKPNKIRKTKSLNVKKSSPATLKKKESKRNTSKKGKDTSVDDDTTQSVRSDFSFSSWRSATGRPKSQKIESISLTSPSEESQSSGKRSWLKKLVFHRKP